MPLAPVDVLWLVLELNGAEFLRTRCVLYVKYDYLILFVLSPLIYNCCFVGIVACLSVIIVPPDFFKDSSY